VRDTEIAADVVGRRPVDVHAREHEMEIEGGLRVVDRFDPENDHGVIRADPRLAAAVQEAVACADLVTADVDDRRTSCQQRCEQRQVSRL
jgi:hypothetical protein